MTDTERDLVQLLRLAAGCPASVPESPDWEKIWNLACSHHLEVMVFSASRSFPSVPPELTEKMKAARDSKLARAVLQIHYAQRVREALTSAGIHFGMQKGGVLINDYPCIEMRFMSDLDFCIRPEDRPAIRAVLTADGWKFIGTESGDEQFSINGNVGAEFHGRLLYRKTKTGIENYPDWSFVDESVDALTEEGFALNLIGHAVNDLAGPGPGIRYILDLWIYRHRHRPQPDWDAVFSRLGDDGILTPAKNLLDLSEYLFGDGEGTPLMEEMADYVMKGGLHGDARRAAASEAAAAGGKNKVLRKQFLRSKTEFENRYPWLKKYPFLLPFCRIMRLFKSLRTHKTHIKEWNRTVKGLTEEEIRTQKEALCRFGL